MFSNSLGSDAFNKNSRFFNFWTKIEKNFFKNGQFDSFVQFKMRQFLNGDCSKLKVTLYISAISIHMCFHQCISTDRLENDKIVIYEEGWEASNIIGIIVLISLTVTCFIRVAFDRAF